jgi:adenylate cyclase
VGEELGVQYILEGSVRKSGERIRITSQLIDALSGRHLWAQRFDRHLGDILAVQDEITRNVITSVQIALTEGEQVRAAGAGTESLDAYLAYLQAIKNIRFFTVQGNALGRRLARKAIELDPNYAVAYRALAITHSMDVWLGTSQSPKQSLEECMALLQKAIELDPDYADAHSSLGFTLTMLGRHQEAIAAAERGVALNPNSAEAYALLANALRFAGRPRDAIAMYNKAIRLNPIPPAYYFFGLGHACSMNGQHEQAVRWCQKAVRSAPDNFLAHLTATVVFSKAGREADARDSALQVLRVNHGYSLAAHEKRATMIGKEAYFEALRKSGLQ